jgi:diadenosine tetraphosphate (Ap4A) HIT family hydrolase
LNDLDSQERVNFLRDMVLIGDAILEVTGAARINYEILGNSEPALHVHILPRYEAEPEDLRRGPIWFYDWSKAPKFDPAIHKPLMDKLRTAIEKRVK